LPRVSGLGPGDRVAPDLRIVGQGLDVLRRLLLVLAMLQEARAGGPEHRRALAAGELGRRCELEQRRVVPVLGHAQRRVEVLSVVADPLGGEGDLVRSSVHAAIGRAGHAAIREWRGVEHTVAVLADGFEWEGRRYKSPRGRSRDHRHSVERAHRYDGAAGAAPARRWTRRGAGDRLSHGTEPVSATHDDTLHVGRWRLSLPGMEA
jgi:hypothetical protein